MSFDPIIALGALDGRYRSKIEPLAPIMSEFGLLHARVEVECRWFEALAAHPDIHELPSLTNQQSKAIGRIYSEFSLDAAGRIKTLEQTTNHDVKALSS